MGVCKREMWLSNHPNIERRLQATPSSDALSDSGFEQMSKVHEEINVATVVPCTVVHDSPKHFVLKHNLTTTELTSHVDTLLSTLLHTYVDT